MSSSSRLPSLPEKIILSPTGKTTATLTPIEKKEALSGVSEKKVYEDTHKNLYFVKRAKKRTVEGIFSEAFSKEQLAEIKSNPVLYAKFEQHVRDIEQGHIFQEVLMTRLSVALFGDSIRVPENSFYTNPDTGEALIISKGIPGFTEVLSDRLKNYLEKIHAKTLDDVKPEQYPLREDFKLSPEEAKTFGQMLAFVHVFDAWDNWNIIDLSNSGYVRDGEKLYPTVVDFGNMGFTGFSGKTKFETAFSNPELKKAIDSPDSTNIDFSKKDLRGFQHCLPSGETVYPLPPRLAVKDLLSMNGDDSISTAMRAGYVESCEMLLKTLPDFNTRIEKAIEETLTQYTDKKDIHRAKALLKETFYLDFAPLLKARIQSMQGIKNQLLKGVSLEDIAEQQLKKIAFSQSFFKPAPEGKGDSKIKFPDSPRRRSTGG